MTTREQTGQIDATPTADDRIEAFRQQLQAMRVPGARPRSDRIVSVLAVVAMTASIVLAVVAYVMSHGTTDPREQNDAIVLAALAAAIGVVGVGLFVNKGVERLLRFWIARVTFEQSAQTDRLLAQGEQLQQLLHDLLRDRDASRVG